METGKLEKEAHHKDYINPIILLIPSMVILTWIIWRVIG